jgi:hypothetical protein
MGVKIELEKNEIGWLWNALDIAHKDYNKTIDNLSKNRKITKKEKESLIKDLLDEQGKIDKLNKFFKGL